MHQPIPLPKRSNPLKPLGRMLLFVFILMNIIAMFQGWAFTHFNETAGERIKAEQMDAFQKVKMLFFGAPLPRPRNTETPSQEYESVTLKSNVMLSAWYIKTMSSKPKGTILLFHGYQGNKSALLELSDAFLAMGYNTLLTDFMGSGGSEGNQTTIGYKEAENIKTAYDYIAGRGEKNIYLYGSSMGAASVMKAINDYKLSPKAIVVGCPFGSMYGTVGKRFEIMGVPKFPMAGLLTFWGGIENGFWAFGHNPEDYAKNITCPTLLLWGEQDNRVDYDEILAIYNNLAGPKDLHTFIHSGHGQYIETEPEAWHNTVESFLKNH
ncbi:MAG: alpha/beta hydrolase [Bacteroidia bacterium]